MKISQKFHSFKISPWAALGGEFSLVQVDDGLHAGVVSGVSYPARGGFTVVISGGLARGTRLRLRRFRNEPIHIPAKDSEAPDYGLAGQVGAGGLPRSGSSRLAAPHGLTPIPDRPRGGPERKSVPIPRDPGLVDCGFVLH